MNDGARVEPVDRASQAFALMSARTRRPADWRLQLMARSILAPLLIVAALSLQLSAQGSKVETIGAFCLIRALRSRSEALWKQRATG